MFDFRQFDDLTRVTMADIKAIERRIWGLKSRLQRETDSSNRADLERQISELNREIADLLP